MESTPQERDAVKKVTGEAEDLILTLRENVGDPGVSDGFADTEYPPIISDEEFYRVPSTQPVDRTPIMGNKPYVPDVVPSAKTVRAVETDQRVVQSILGESELALADEESSQQSTSYSPVKDGQTAVSFQNGKMVVQKSSQPSFWKRLLGGK